MKRGWRNDPAWIAHYAKRDEDMAKRQIERIKFENLQQMLQVDVDSAFMRMPRPTLTTDLV